MKKLKSKSIKFNFLTEHPLRSELSQKDWKRIQAVIDRKLPEYKATTDEITAAHDVFYDAIAGSEQTHLGVYILQ